MKHNLEVTLIIIGMFAISQILGLFLVTSYDYYFGATAQEQGIQRAGTSFVYESVPPAIEIKTAFDVTQIVLSLMFAIAIATLAFFLLSKIRITIVIKAWFTFVIFICLSLAFSLSLYPVTGVKMISLFGTTFSLAEVIALPLAAICTYFKIFKRNILVHNFSEIFVYPALAVIFLPLLNVLVASILLVLISIYDMWAVWKTKHMIKLAKFQMHHLKIFTGFLFPYINKKDRVKIKKAQVMAKRIKEKRKSQKFFRERIKKLKIRANLAALGGGDVAFPLMFAATVFFAFNMLAALIVILCSTLSLMFLFYISEKGKFYPAMPFLSIGCFLGLAIVLLFF